MNKIVRKKRIPIKSKKEQLLKYKRNTNVNIPTIISAAITGATGGAVIGATIGSVPGALVGGAIGFAINGYASMSIKDKSNDTD